MLQRRWEMNKEDFLKEFPDYTSLMTDALARFASAHNQPVEVLFAALANAKQGKFDGLQEFGIRITVTKTSLTMHRNGRDTLLLTANGVITAILLIALKS